MTGLLRLSVFALLVAAALPLPRAACAQPPAIERIAAEPAHARRLEDGGIVLVDDVGFPGVFGRAAAADADSTLVMFLVEASPAAAWRLLTDFERHPEFMPHMTASRHGAPGPAGHDGRVCYDYEILWIDSTSCYVLERRRAAGLLVGRLDAALSDERLRDVSYFWHLRAWDEGRLLLAYYQSLRFTSGMAAFGHEAFVGPRRTAKAVRAELGSRVGRD